MSTSRKPTESADATGREGAAEQPEQASARQPEQAPDSAAGQRGGKDRRPAADEGDETQRRAGEPESESGEEVASDLDALLAEARRERDEYLELAQRAKADFENYRRRSVREAAEAAKRGKAELARELMPSIDNLERALRAAGVDPNADPAPAADSGAATPPSEEVSAHEALARGVALVYRELHATLVRAGLEPFDPEGERFDPTMHEALQTRDADGVESGTVVETVERGWQMDGQVLRPARVIVAG